MLRKSNSDPVCQLKVGHLKLLIAFFAGCAVTFTIFYFFFGREETNYDWDDDFDPIYSNYRLPEHSDADLKKIQEQFNKKATCKSTKEHREGCTYLTLITKDDYIELALVLGESIRASASDYSLAAMVTPAVSARGIDLLNRASIKVIKTEPIPLPASVQPWREYWKETYVKLNMFGLTQYERVVYLDADSLVMMNLDELFEQPGEFLTATDRHLCRHDTEPGSSTMVSVVWPNSERHKEIVGFFNESGYVFSRGDQSVSEDYFANRHSASKLDESWSSFVFRCQCADFKGTVGSPDGPKSVHFTGWFRPHVTSHGVSIPAGLSANAKECGKPYYDHWEAMWQLAIKRQGLNQDEFLKENIRHSH